MTSRRTRIYEGKAKILYEGPEPGTVIVHFKDDATAFDAQCPACLRRAIVRTSSALIVSAVVCTRSLRLLAIRFSTARNVITSTSWSISRLGR